MANKGILLTSKQCPVILLNNHEGKAFSGERKNSTQARKSHAIGSANLWYPIWPFTCHQMIGTMVSLSTFGFGPSSIGSFNDIGNLARPSEALPDGYQNRRARKVLRCQKKVLRASESVVP
jgi:hypothetical protein